MLSAAVLIRSWLYGHICCFNIIICLSKQIWVIDWRADCCLVGRRCIWICLFCMHACLYIVYLPLHVHVLVCLICLYSCVCSCNNEWRLAIQFSLARFSPVCNLFIHFSLVCYLFVQFPFVCHLLICWRVSLCPFDSEFIDVGLFFSHLFIEQYAVCDFSVCSWNPTDSHQFHFIDLFVLFAVLFVLLLFAVAVQLACGAFQHLFDVRGQHPGAAHAVLHIFPMFFSSFSFQFIFLVVKFFSAHVLQFFTSSFL